MKKRQPRGQDLTRMKAVRAFLKLSAKGKVRTPRVVDMLIDIGYMADDAVCLREGREERARKFIQGLRKFTRGDGTYLFGVSLYEQDEQGVFDFYYREAKDTTRDEKVQALTYRYQTIGTAKEKFRELFDVFCQYDDASDLQASLPFPTDGLLDDE